LPRPTVMSFVEGFGAERTISEDELCAPAGPHPLIERGQVVFARTLVLELKRQRDPRQEFIDSLASAGLKTMAVVIWGHFRCPIDTD